MFTDGKYVEANLISQRDLFHEVFDPQLRRRILAGKRMSSYICKSVNANLHRGAKIRCCSSMFPAVKDENLGNPVTFLECKTFG